MFSNSELERIRKILSKSEKRLYFFDDDADGLISFFLLQKRFPFIDFKCLLTAPIDETPYLEKMNEVDFDLSIILDRPIVTQKVINSLENVLWIDHHPIQRMNNVQYFNPRIKNVNTPTSYLSYQILNRETIENKLWCLLGCIWDYYLPLFFEEIRKTNPKLINTKSNDLDVIHFESRLGYIIRILSFLLTGTNDQIRENIKIILTLGNPLEILENEKLKEHYLEKEKNYERLISEANKYSRELSENLILFNYTSKESYTSYLSNHLRFLFKKNVIVAKEFEKGKRITMSIRSTNIDLHKILPKAMRGLRGGYGGHEHACGGHILKEDFEIFLNRMRALV